MSSRLKVDWWLTGICSVRALIHMVVMTYAAALPVLQQEWQMTAAAAGGIAGGYQIGHALSLFALPSLPGRVGVYTTGGYHAAGLGAVWADYRLGKIKEWTGRDKWKMT